MGRHREASLVLEEASKMDPLNCQIRLHLEAATQGVLKDLLAGVFLLSLPCTQNDLDLHQAETLAISYGAEDITCTRMCMQLQLDELQSRKHGGCFVTIYACLLVSQAMHCHGRKCETFRCCPLIDSQLWHHLICSVWKACICERVVESRSSRDDVSSCMCTGKGKELRLLTAPQPTQRITYHPHSAPLYKIKTDNMLPVQLLTPFQVRAASELAGHLYPHLVTL